MFNKRGQEGVTLGTLILIILGAVALIAIIMGFTGAWGFIFSKIGLLPGQSLQALAQSCVVSAEAELNLDYCSFKEVTIEGESDERWINCDYGPVRAEVDRQVTGALPDCGDDLASDKCKQLVESEQLDAGESIMINDKTCQVGSFEIGAKDDAEVEVKLDNTVLGTIVNSDKSFKPKSNSG